MINKNILEITENNLCTGCGTCIPLCPSKAIKIQINSKKGIYIPNVNKLKCNGCGICYQICPGSEIDFEGLNKDIFNKKIEDPIIGSYIKSFTGYSKDPHIRYNSSSGGLITQILIFALNNNIIDGALVTRMRKDKPLEPEPFIARTEEEIIEASGSKYCPVPTNMVLDEIIKSSNEKFAVVGLPCQITGIRKAELINKTLKDKIILHIGILCNHTPNLVATEYFLYSKKINNNNIKKINYRSGGWIPKMEITFKNNESILENYWGDGFGQFFYPIRCTLCCDIFALLSDISFGDAWLPEIEKIDKIGTSLIIIRNSRGENILKKVLSKDKLTLNPLIHEKLLKSQFDKVYFKNISLITRMNILKFFRKEIPFYKIPTYNYNYKNTDYLNSIFLYIILNVSLKRYMWPLMTNLIKIFKKIKKIE
ncbi:Coenzyme F420 hydrogenase/dehydrogenase, beta subunit C-terminal domain [Methanobacterium sp.]|uniref:Coenzyme F420 hydrogenase/dehydrogenase, beta subunit C-terminal domain n=1 Tax=Methanobacterium sp. TaxID=2164 RepID=UPI003158EEB6